MTVLRARAALGLVLILGAPAAAACTTPALAQGFACRPHACSNLLPAGPPDATEANDCAYLNRNLWWLDYVAGSLTWGAGGERKPVTVAVFDDGVDVGHEDLQGQLWINAAEAGGKPGVDDDGNGYIDDLNGWDFVDGDGIVSPEGECIGRASHGTFMASLIAAKRNNGIGIAAAGSDGARVMVLRIVGCGRDHKDRADPARIEKALRYASRMGAKIMSFSNHWSVSSPSLDAAFAEIAERPGPRAALVVASVPNRGELNAGYPAAYAFSRIVRAVPVGNDDEISPGTSAAPIGLNFGSPSACVLGATATASGYAIMNGSSNSAAILAGLLAGIWSSPAYATFGADEFVAEVVRGKMSASLRRSKAGSRPPYQSGVPLADACMLASPEKSARICRPPQSYTEDPR